MRRHTVEPLCLQPERPASNTCHTTHLLPCDPPCPLQNQELAYKLKVANESSAAITNWRHKYEEVRQQGAVLHQKYQEKKALVERVGGAGWSGLVYVALRRCCCHMALVL